MASSSRIYPIVSLITLGCFILILADRLIENPLLRALADWLYMSMVILGAVALLLGILNVMVVHVRRIRMGEKEWSFSLLLVLCLLGTFVAGVASENGIFAPIVSWLFDTVIAPGQAALFALLPFFLAVAAWRYLRIDQKGGGWMLIGVLLMLLIQMPAAANSPLSGFMQITDWVWLDAFVTSVMRGLLLGGGLTMLAVTLRWMLGRG